jgi:asparagine synthase (glutamine-hydrolysing)
MPDQVRKAIKSLIRFVPGTGNISTAGDRFNRLASFFCQPTFKDAHLYMTTTMNDTEINYLTQLGCQDQGINDLAIMPPEMTSPLNKMLALDCKNLLPERFLMKADKATMANSIEERLPLLDKEIIEFAFTIPPRLKIKNGREKYILRKAVEDLLPPQIVSRKKMGFDTPVAYWLKNRRLKELVIDKLSNGELINTYFKKEAVDQVVKNLEQGRVNKAYEASAIWTIFVLELWYDIYFHGERQESLF